MKILHINNNYVDTALHRQLIVHMHSKEYECTVYAPVLYGTRVSDNFRKYEIISKCFEPYDRFFFKHKQKKIYKDLLLKITPNSYDLIHAHTLFSDGNVAYRINKEYGIPYIAAIRDTDVNVFFKYMKHLKSLGIQIILKASAIVFLSNTYRQYVLDNIIPARIRNEISKKAVIIPNGIDPFWINNTGQNRRLDLEKNKLTALSVGKINKRKNQIVAARAIEMLNKSGINAKLTIVGKAENRKLLKKLQRYSFVEYYEPVKMEKLIDFYRSADIFVLPSKTETFGLAYAEAMSQGLPVLYSKGQGFDGQFDEGTVGFHIESQSAKDLCKKIRMIISNYNEISLNCTTKVTKFDWVRIADIYRALYDDVLNSHDRKEV